jgi:hypothetical protein
MDTNGERIISADDHMDLHVMPPRLFVDRVAASWRDRVPVVVDTDDGPCWSLDGAIVGPSGRKAKGLLAADAHGFRPGVAEERLEDLDRDGVEATVVYGPPFGLEFVEDPLVRAECLRVQRLGRRVQRRRPRPPRRARDAPGARRKPRPPSCSGSPRSGTATGGVLRGRDPRSRTTGTFWAVANDVAIPIHFHLSGGMHSTAFVGWQRPVAVR